MRGLMAFACLASASAMKPFGGLDQWVAQPGASTRVRHALPRAPCLASRLRSVMVSVPRQANEPAPVEGMSLRARLSSIKLRTCASLSLIVLLWVWPWLFDWLRFALTQGTVHATAPRIVLLAEQLVLLREIAMRLVLAAGCGAIIGLERKSADRPAGLRSMTLVSIGSALYLLAVSYGIHNGDPARAAAQVCTGVGFIGAGVIAKGTSVRDPVRGVTTACAVWVSAALGVVAASGLWLLAIYATGLTVTVLRVSRWYNISVQEPRTPLIGVDED